MSDWELEEIRNELASGVAPDIVAFRHGLPSHAIPKRRNKGNGNMNYKCWTDAEKAFVADNYRSHKTRDWSGWSVLKRSWESIKRMAYKLGVTGDGDIKCWDADEIEFLRENYPMHGRTWEGWKELDRTWTATVTKAKQLGLRRKHR